MNQVTRHRKASTTDRLSSEVATPQFPESSTVVSTICSRILTFQTFKNRTFGIRSTFRTSLHQFPQYLFHGLKCFDFAFYVSNLRFRSPSDFGIICLWRHTQCQQFANFAQRKAKLLSTFDKFQPPCRVRGIEPITRGATGRLGKKPVSFVEAHGFQVDAHFSRKATDRERVCAGSCHHKSNVKRNVIPGVWYGVKSDFSRGLPYISVTASRREAISLFEDQAGAHVEHKLEDRGNVRVFCGNSFLSWPHRHLGPRVGHTSAVFPLMGTVWAAGLKETGVPAENRRGRACRWHSGL